MDSAPGQESSFREVAGGRELWIGWAADLSLGIGLLWKGPQDPDVKDSEH